MAIMLLIFKAADAQSQFQVKIIVDEKDFTAKYYTNEDYVLITIFSKYVPTIFTDINKNNVIDPYVEKEYSVIQGNNLCVANVLEDKASTTCDSWTKMEAKMDLLWEKIKDKIKGSDNDKEE